jgi:hypothetical protein
MLIRCELRRRWRSLAALAVALGLGLGVALSVGAAAHRTDTAYERYLDAAEVGDLVINPSIATDEIGAAIEDLPGVQRSTTASLMSAGIVEDAEVVTVEDFLTDTGYVVFGSRDGRYLDMDRPAVHRGRLADGEDEVFVTVDAADRLDLDVGDRFPLAFFPSNLAFAPAATVPLDAEVPRLGTHEVTVVGIGTLPDESLPDDLYERGVIIVSPDLADRYGCLGGVPPIDAAEDEIIDVLLPPGCAFAYQYWSLALADGAAGTDRAEEAFVARAAVLGERLPAVLDNVGSYFLISSTTAEEVRRVDDAVRPTVTALTLFAIAAGLATVLTIATVLARLVRGRDAELRSGLALGMTRRQRATAAAVPLLLAAVAGVVVAVAFAAATSPLGPVGEASAIEPHPGFALDPVLLPGATAAALVLALVVLGLSWRAARRASAAEADDRASGGRLLARVTRAPSPAAAEGLRAALGRGGGARVVLAGSTLAVAALVAATTFGTNLDRLIDEPERYGWPWDLAAVVGSGYGGTLKAEVDQQLGEVDGVAGWGHAATTPDVTVDGVLLTAVVDLGDFDQVEVVDGRLPQSSDEVALGQITARDLGVEPGDEVQVGGGDGLIVQGDVQDDGLTGAETRTAEVTGTVVLPPIGPYEARRADPGQGAFLSSAWLPPGALEAEDSPASFVGVQLEEGADPDDVLDQLGGAEGLRSWSGDADTRTYTGPVRPPQIVDASSMRNGPLAMAGVLVGAMVLALGVSLGLSVRTRRRELAILRAVGFGPRALRATVRWQTLTVLAVGLLVGLPVGVAVGRATWTRFAADLGVDPSAAVPWPWLLVTAAGTIVLGLLAGLLPARSATSAAPASVLHEEQ